MAPRKTPRALDLVTEKGSSAWLTMLPLQDLGFNLNKREFRDAVKPQAAQTQVTREECNVIYMP